MKRFCKDPRNMSILSFLLTGNVINKKFAFYDVALKHDIFDNDIFMKNNTGYFATVTNVETGQAEYLEMKDVIRELEEKGEIFVVRPSEPILVNTIERDPEKLQQVYELGMKDCSADMERLKAYLNR